MKIKNINKVGTRKVYDLSVRDAEHYVLENGVVTHNTGIYYSADQIFIIGRQQEKEGTEVIGYNFIINVEKSRFVREKSKIPVEVTFEGGISKWSGLLDVALEGGFVIKPSNGWYSIVNKETGEVSDKKCRLKDTYTKEFWLPILADASFPEWVENKYCMGSNLMIQEESILEEDIDDTCCSISSCGFLVKETDEAYIVALSKGCNPLRRAKRLCFASLLACSQNLKVQAPNKVCLNVHQRAS